jgi:predicted nucleic acid-binding protein
LALSVLIDANILLYAKFSDFPQHDPAREHGLTVVSTDADFARFPQLKWFNPIRA